MSREGAPANWGMKDLRDIDASRAAAARRTVAVGRDGNARATDAKIAVPNTGCD